jgi:hypothetical protein
LRLLYALWPARLPQCGASLTKYSERIVESLLAWPART